jgi:hypothetical protein
VGKDLHIVHLRETEPMYRLREPIPIPVPPPSYPPPYPKSYLGRLIAKFQTRSSIILDGEQLSDQDMKIVVAQAILGKRCVKLSLRNTNMTSEGILMLAKGISESTTLEELDLSDNHLSDKDLVPLMRELSLIGTITVEQWKFCGIAKLTVSK